ncbi:type VI secretion system secreted protein VgrG [Luteibacter sp. Sphag1AF]|uniref:type VI secretion system Vgr family protein n=1 Tax=Luteibacter sp. Sphag1AF TaxID=2587031 RepID=UPI0016180CEF|nr:type VI secretion system tip protein TssI/VgrG [Luteibacter sp. Sphag1AF]MBB3226949.1 type VI secretion system secreted protein VgrG [Luteibacter sp. Sphag1AF]
MSRESDAVDVFRCWLIVENAGKPLRVSHLMLSDALSELPTYQLTCPDALPERTAQSLAGALATLEVCAGKRVYRRFQGVLAQVVRMERGRYRFVLRPWLWLATLAADCRIFRQRSVRSIVDEVLSAYPARVAWECSPDDPPREHCVQYRESDYRFVTRLLADIGVYFFFRHTPAGEEMVIVDSAASHAVSDGEALPWLAAMGDSNVTWESAAAVTSTAVTLGDFAWQRATNRSAAMLCGEAMAPADEYALAIYDYPAGSEQRGHADALARQQLDAVQAAANLCRAGTRHPAISVGQAIALDDERMAGESGRFVVTRLTLSISAPSENVGNHVEPVIRGEFHALSVQRSFRADPIPRPVITGVQTAIVVGGDMGTQVSDADGRVKLRFHWEHAASPSDDAGCWVRVAQPLAGAGWGASFLPRVGQEVVVGYLDGDPDRPIITGSVYNAGQRPPYEYLPARTLAGYRSRSLGDAAISSELRFDDTAGEESLDMHAGRDASLIVDHDIAVHVKHESHHVIDGNAFARHAADCHADTGGDTFRLVRGDAHCDVLGRQVQRVGGDLEQTVAGSVQLCIDADTVLTAGADIDVKVTGTVTIETGDALILRAGSSSLVIDADGIALHGTKITLDGSGDVLIHGGAPPPSRHARNAQRATPRRPKPPRAATITEPSAVPQEAAGNG